MSERRRTNRVQEECTEGVFASLPLISVLGKKEMGRAKELLEEIWANEYMPDPETGEPIRRSEYVDRMKKELAELQQKNGVEGLRFNKWAFRSLERPGRKTLSKKLLVENGVEAEVIEASMQEGKPFVENRFVYLG